MVESMPDPETIKQGFNEIMSNNVNVLAQREPDILFTYAKGKTVQMLFSFWCKDVAKLDITKSEVSKELYAFLHEKGINVL